MEQKLIDAIVEFNPGLSKDLLIYELYTSLAPFFERDLSYFLASDEEKYAKYQKGFSPKGKYIVCSTLADFYVKLYNEFGIEAKKVPANSAKIPLFVVVVKGELGWYYLDPLNDLFYNQYNIRPVNFGVVPRFKTINESHPDLIKLPPSYLSDLEKDLNKQYYNSLIDDLHEKMAPRNVAYEFLDIPNGERNLLTMEKIKFMNDYLINLGHVNGPYERVLLYLYLYTHLLDSSEKRRLNVLLNKDNPSNYHVNIRLDTDQVNYLMYEEVREDNKYKLIRTL